MGLVLDENAQLARVEQDLLSRFEHVPHPVVCAEVQAGLHEFDGARIRAFVPVLVQKRVRDRLRTRT